jgi:hypothetical protein
VIYFGNIFVPERTQKTPQKRPFGKQNDAISLKTLDSSSLDWRENQTYYEISFFLSAGAKHLKFRVLQPPGFPIEGTRDAFASRFF